MYYFLSAFSAFLIAIMVAVNAKLSIFCGLYSASAIVHITGLIAATSAALLAKRKLNLSVHAPLSLYVGGIIGFFTTFFNFLAVNQISVTAILALSLLGQAIFSLVTDQFGFFGMPVRKFSFGKLLGVTITGLGVCVLLFDRGKLLLIPVIASLLSGATVVSSRQINSQLATHIGFFGATWVNYAAGLITSLAALLIASLLGFGLGASYSSPPFWIFLGGPIGAVIVFISNICVSKMPSFIMTLVMFAGQVFGGVAIDALTTGIFSWRSLLGGIFAFLGLILNVLFDKKSTKKA